MRSPEALREEAHRFINLAKYGCRSEIKNRIRRSSIRLVSTGRGTGKRDVRLETTSSYEHFPIPFEAREKHSDEKFEAEYLRHDRRLSGCRDRGRGSRRNQDRNRCHGPIDRYRRLVSVLRRGRSGSCDEGDLSLAAGASLWCSKRKVHETRHWQCSHRGWLLVHAAKRFETDFDLDDRLRLILDDEFGRRWVTELPTGALIGMVDVVNCLPTQTLFGDTAASDDDRECGDFGPGRFAWKRGEFRLFGEPIPYRGAQGIFNVPDDVVPIGSGIGR